MISNNLIVDQMLGSIFDPSYQLNRTVNDSAAQCIKPLMEVRTKGETALSYCQTVQQVCAAARELDHDTSIDDETKLKAKKKLMELLD